MLFCHKWRVHLISVERNGIAQMDSNLWKPSDLSDLTSFSDGFICWKNHEAVLEDCIRSVGILCCSVKNVNNGVSVTCIAFPLLKVPTVICQFNLLFPNQFDCNSLYCIGMNFIAQSLSNKISWSFKFSRISLRALLTFRLTVRSTYFFDSWSARTPLKNIWKIINGIKAHSL